MYTTILAQVCVQFKQLHAKFPTSTKSMNENVHTKLSKS